MALWGQPEQSSVSPTSEPYTSEQPSEQPSAHQAPEHAPAYVSVVNEFPEDLYDAMREFVRTHPQWDQYRLMQASLAGFLFQHGSSDRAVARHYLNGLFRREGSRQLPPGPIAAPQVKPAPQPRTAPPRLVPISQAQQPAPERSWPAAA